MENLSTQFSKYADTQTQEGIKFFYDDIAEALHDDDFVLTLHSLGYGDTLKRMDRDFANSVTEYYINQYRSALREIYVLYATKKMENKTKLSSIRYEVRNLEKRISEAQSDVDNISKISGILSGTEMLEAYAEDFNKEVKEHEKKARNWLNWLIMAIILWAIIAATLLCVQLADYTILDKLIADDLSDGMEIPRIVAIAIKGGILVAYTQIPLFLKKNYYAERHLEQANIHRCNVLKSLHAVYNVVSDEKERDKLLTIGATVAFSEPESGFITRKEGAGNDNAGLESLLKTLSK